MKPILFILVLAGVLLADDDSTTVYITRDTVHWEAAVTGIMFDVPKKGDITFITNAGQYIKPDPVNGLLYNALGANLIWYADSQKTDKKTVDDFRKACIKELKKRKK